MNYGSPTPDFISNQIAPWGSLTAPRFTPAAFSETQLTLEKLEAQLLSLADAIGERRRSQDNLQKIIDVMQARFSTGQTALNRLKAEEEQLTEQLKQKREELSVLNAQARLESLPETAA